MSIPYAAIVWRLHGQQGLGTLPRGAAPTRQERSLRFVASRPTLDPGGDFLTDELVQFVEAHSAIAVFVRSSQQPLGNEIAEDGPLQGMRKMRPLLFVMRAENEKSRILELFHFLAE